MDILAASTLTFAEQPTAAGLRTALKLFKRQGQVALGRDCCATASSALRSAVQSDTRRRHSHRCICTSSYYAYVNVSLVCDISAEYNNVAARPAESNSDCTSPLLGVAVD